MIGTDGRCTECNMLLPPNSVHTCKHVSIKDAMKHIAEETSTLDFLQTHGGFFSPELPFRHPLHYENNIILWPPVDIAPTAKIGEGTVIGRYTNIVGPAKIGKHCRLQGFNFIPEGVEIGDFVFVGPGAIFTNVKYPRVRSREEKLHKYEYTIVEDGANIGAGAIILPGIRIGSKATIGAGAVVTKDVENGVTFVGVPAKEIYH